MAHVTLQPVQAPGKYGTVQNPDGSPRKFRTKREAEQAAGDEEAKVRGGRWKDPADGHLTFSQFANRWYAGLDLAASTMVNYRRDLETHLLPTFEDTPLADIFPADVDAWEKGERAAGYKPSSVATWRATLHTVLADAVDAGLIGANPATRRRGKGKRAGAVSRARPERIITDPLGALLIAERAAILAGRDDEFVLVTLTHYTGIRWAEVTGLETRYARLRSIRVEWQLVELDPGGFTRCPPKEDSYRDVGIPGWLSVLVSDHITRTAPSPCACHGFTYIFRGQRGGAHWRRSGFGDWVFEPAVSGWFPKRAPQPRRPVPIFPEPWPGRPVRGWDNQARAEACWLPVAAGLTPHGLRHSHKSLMAELRTPEVLSHERLGHQLGGVGGRYSHVTPMMREELLGQLTERWNQALDARAAITPHSPVAVLEALLQARLRSSKKGEDPKIFSQSSPREGVTYLSSRPRKGA